MQLTLGTFKALGQMIKGTRSVDELGGPVRIGQMSGDFGKNRGLLHLCGLWLCYRLI